MLKSISNRMRIFSTAILLATVPLSACVSNSAQMQSSQDGRFTLHDIRLQKGGMVHWAVLGVDNAAGGQVIVNFGGETMTLGRQLVENLVSPGVLAAVISGAAGIRISENGSCGGSGCSGDIFYVQAVSGSVSGAEAEAGAEASSGGGNGVHKSSKGGDHLVVKLTKKELALHTEALKVLGHALDTAY
jgi:hypothetical protein